MYRLAGIQQALELFQFASLPTIATSAVGTDFNGLIPLTRVKVG
jgi:hypothetical protein